jgi:hypothetical protein
MFESGIGDTAGHTGLSIVIISEKPRCFACAGGIFGCKGQKSKVFGGVPGHCTWLHVALGEPRAGQI